MAHKKEDFYFKSFIDCANCSYRAAKTLRDILSDFDVKTLPVKLDELHAIENDGDVLSHQLMSNLIRAFITPIERDDIINLAHIIDDTTDAIDDILIHIYTNNISRIRPECAEFCALLVKCTESMYSLLCEFADFHKSKNLETLIVELNTLEEDGDRLYIKAMRDLHVNEKDALEIISWREIFDYFEKCFDMCEHVADIVGSVALLNS